MSGFPPIPPVTFNYTNWLARYPEFTTTTTSDSAQLCFNEVELYCANVLCLVWNVGTLTILLNMLTAHIAQLYFGSVLPTGPQLAGPIVGRISAATEGSVSVTAENDYPPGSPQWYQSTKYGASFWAATAPYRTARYAPGNPMRPAFPGFFGWPFNGRGY